METIYAPGARIEVRDAEWLVRRVDRTSTGGQALSVVGISELVKNKEAIFLTEVERSIAAIDPLDTRLVQDTSTSYISSMLYMESLLRQTPPTDNNLYTGHKGAMDLVPFQMDPAIQALDQPRQRILIADAVGLGKTIEAGILLSELIRRGRGKRILVVAVKSMLTQFQKELWCRFTIPLTRLDSIGIQRIRSHIPTSHNPFYYFDKAIISIDTLKQDAEYRTYLENAYWDVIVIDEAQNVAERGKGSSLRSKLARLLARRSDTLIMLSATPHDGRARSFASLMNMLDPTAIADPDKYGPEDIKGLFIRRFKKDIQNQVEAAFKERKISKKHCPASPVEESLFDAFTNLEFKRLDQRRGAEVLFKTTLEKSLFSSPAACLQTIRNRVNRLRKLQDLSYEEDIHSLEDFARQVERITPKEFSKYQNLLSVIRNPDPDHGFGWTGKDPKDRLVIFTERIETLHFLHKNLKQDLGLQDPQVEILHGTMPDGEQQRVVEEFGIEDKPVRLLIGSDVASEGINLHYLSHRMIHFDIPWSLMVFQQRNGRIDRYGQERTPEIVYLVTESGNRKIKGDTRILELLIDKDEKATKNIGDPSALMGVYDIDAEEKVTAGAIEEGQTTEEFEATLERMAFDPLSLIMGSEKQPAGESSMAKSKGLPSLFADDYTYIEAALKQIHQQEPLQAEFCPAECRIEITAPEGLRHRFRFLPREIWPDEGVFTLSSDIQVIQEEIKRSRKEEKAWPRIHYLWEMNPLLEWVNDKAQAAFRRQEAPVITLHGAMESHEVVFLVSGLIPNRKGHPLIHHWVGITFREGRFCGIAEFEAFIGHTGLGRRPFPNMCEPMDTGSLQSLLPKAVEMARQWMTEKRHAFEDEVNEKLNEQYMALEHLKGKHYEQLEISFGESRQPEKIVESRKEKRRREIDQIFDEFLEWVQDTMTTEDNPYIRVVAVFKGAE